MVNLEELRKEAQTKELALRSCWNCNPAHEHLKEADYVIMCIECGNFYYKGEKITEE